MRVFHEELDLVDPLLHHPGKYGIDDLHGDWTRKNNRWWTITKTRAFGASPNAYGTSILGFRN